MTTTKTSEDRIVEKKPCLLCGENHFNKLFSALDFDSGKVFFGLIECENCHLVRTNPVPTDSELEKYYALPYYGSGTDKFIGVAETLTYCSNYLRSRSILSHIHGSKRFPANAPIKILDIGCGRGHLLKILQQKGFDCHGIERADFPKDNEIGDIHIYKQEIEDVGFSENFFDTVLIWHVLEHVSDPISMVREATRILRPGGLLTIAVPNFGSFQARFFREDWFHLDLPRHIHHFTPAILLRILDENGFSSINKHTFSFEQNPFGFIQSFFNKTISPNAPNRFYSLLKKTKRSSSTISLLMWSLLASLLLPLALFEYFISGILGQGATFVVYAQKK
jgi:2-polyprenyl-3-methyl-5-hydroxy-6-metoxy-1,4-benzoquinol methylase